MADKWPLANGNWSNAANWNGGTKPVAGDDVYADGRTLNVDESFTVATIRNTQRTGGTLGGTFNFNTSGVTGDVTSATQAFFVGATNAITVTATTGTVTINFSSSITTPLTSNTNAISYTGNCNLTMSSVSFNGVGVGNSNNAILINKSSTGTITLNGNIVGGTSNGGNQNNTLLSTAGATIVNGNVSGLGSGNTGPNYGISQNAGTLVVNGNVTGGNNSAANHIAILFSGTSLTINGVTTGGSGTGASIALSTSSSINNIIGNVTAGTVSAISSTTANIINVTGTVTASATSQAISMTNTNGQVYLNGNMVNNNGKMAIYAPIVWLDANNTTSAAFFTSGGVARTLYSEDTFPNMPAEADTRDNIVYGPGSGLTGTLKMPAAADTRNGVVYDNGTTGTALFTTSLFLTELSSSTVPVAVRMQNLCTPMILGELMEAFKK
jgi:hypothetical protein